MRAAITRTAWARPSVYAPRTPAYLPSIRLVSTQQTATPTTNAKPYRLGVTASNSWPVYKGQRDAGMTQFTLIKKIEGQKKALVEDLAQVLSVEKENIRINPVTQHIKIKGVHVDPVKEWLTSTFGNPKTPKTRPAEATA